MTDFAAPALHLGHSQFAGGKADRRLGRRCGTPLSRAGGQTGQVRLQQRQGIVHFATAHQGAGQHVAALLQTRPASAAGQVRYRRVKTGVQGQAAGPRGHAH